MSFANGSGITKDDYSKQQSLTLDSLHVHFFQVEAIGLEVLETGLNFPTHQVVLNGFVGTFVPIGQQNLVVLFGFEIGVLRHHYLEG